MNDWSYDIKMEMGNVYAVVPNEFPEKRFNYMVADDLKVDNEGDIWKYSQGRWDRQDMCRKNIIIEKLCTGKIKYETPESKTECELIYNEVDFEKSYVEQRSNIETHSETKGYTWKAEVELEAEGKIPVLGGLKTKILGGFERASQTEDSRSVEVTESNSITFKVEGKKPYLMMSKTIIMNEKPGEDFRCEFNVNRQYKIPITLKVSQKVIIDERRILDYSHIDGCSNKDEIKKKKAEVMTQAGSKKRRKRTRNNKKQRKIPSSLSPELSSLSKRLSQIYNLIRKHLK